MGFFKFQALLLVAVAVAFVSLTSSQSTCPTCDCRVGKPQVLDQIISTKIQRVLNGQPSKL